MRQLKLSAMKTNQQFMKHCSYTIFYLKSLYYYFEGLIELSNLSVYDQVKFLC